MISRRNYGIYCFLFYFLNFHENIFKALANTCDVICAQHILLSIISSRVVEAVNITGMTFMKFQRKKLMILGLVDMSTVSHKDMIDRIYRACAQITSQMLINEDVKEFKQYIEVEGLNFKH